MSHIWTFSASSEPYLQRCIAAAPPPDINNKWFQKFGKKDLSAPAESAFEDNQNTANNFENNSSEMEKDATISEDIMDKIKSESMVPEYVIQECTNNPALIKKMAQQLSTNTVEKLFEHIYSKKDGETEFLIFITKFLPTFIKVHNYSRQCLDLLESSNKYPQVFKKLLEILINDTEIPNEVLINYLARLNEESLTTLIKTLSNVEITSEGFSKNVFAIFTAYENCIKTDIIQNYIQSMIIKHSLSCASDNGFGRLFLLFLQTEKTMGRKGNIKVLEECLEIHRSPFKDIALCNLKEINIE